MGRLASVCAIGLGAGDNLLADLPTYRQSDIDVELRVNECVEWPASVAIVFRAEASVGNRYDMTAADAPEAHACPEG